MLAQSKHKDWPGTNTNPIFTAANFKNPQPMLSDGGAAEMAADGPAGTWLRKTLGARLTMSARIRVVRALGTFVTSFIAACSLAAAAAVVLPVGLVFGVGPATFATTAFVLVLVQYIIEALVASIERSHLEGVALLENLHKMAANNLRATHNGGMLYMLGSNNMSLSKKCLAVPTSTRKDAVDANVKDHDDTHKAVVQRHWGSVVQFWTLQALAEFFPLSSLFRNTSNNVGIFHCPLWIKRAGCFNPGLGGEHAADRRIMFSLYGRNLRWIRNDQALLVRLLLTKNIEHAFDPSRSASMVLVLFREDDLPGEAPGLVHLTADFTVRGHVRWMPASMLCDGGNAVPFKLTHSHKTRSTAIKSRPTVLNPITRAIVDSAVVPEGDEHFKDCEDGSPLRTLRADNLNNLLGNFRGLRV